MIKFYTSPTLYTTQLNLKPDNKKPGIFYPFLSFFMKKNFSILLLTFLLFFSGNIFGQISENIQSWTNRASYGTWTQSITAGTVNMTQCIVANAASATGTCTAGRIQMNASSGIVQLPTLSSVGVVEVHLAAGAAGRTLKLQYYDVPTTTWTDLTTWTGIGTTGATFTYTYNTTSSTQLRLSSPSAAVYVHDIIVTTAGTNFFWNGTTTTGTGVASGGSGTWVAASNNWISPTNNASGTPTNWANLTTNIANFANGSGTVTMGTSITAGGTVIGTSGYTFAPNANISLTSPVTLTNLLTVAPATGTTFTMSGVLSGAGGLTQNGAGTTLLSGNSTHTGTTTVTSGTLRLGAAGTSPNSPLGTTTAGTTVSSGGVLDLNGFTLATAEGLTLNGTGISSGGALINSSSTAATYTGAVALASNSSIGTATTGHISIQGAVSGAFTLTKVGAGILNLMGTQSYNGVTVSAGQLQLNPSASFSAAGTCNFNGGTLATSSITSGRTITFGTIDVSAASTLALQSAINHTITFTSAGSLSAMLTITGWTGNYTLGTTGAVTNAGKIFIGNSASLSPASVSTNKIFISWCRLSCNIIKHRTN
jgi:autotransporter-associated beta strand protein